MARFVKVLRPIAGLLIAVLATCAALISCTSTSVTIADDANPTVLSASRLSFETEQPLIAGSSVEPSRPLVVAFTAGSRLERGSLIAISFPTAVQEEAGDLWSIPVASTGDSATPGSCRIRDDSSDAVEIAFAGRTKGGAGRITLRTRRPLQAGETARILMTGQVPKVVPRQPFRVFELVAGTGVLSRTPDENVALAPVVARSAVRLLATLPSDAGAGELFRLRIAAIDDFGNVDSSFRGTLELSGPIDHLPRSVSFSADDRGLKTIDGLAATKPGIARVTIQTTLSSVESTTLSNPMKVSVGAPRFRRLFGDAHFHSGTDVASLSTDGGDHRGQFVSSADAFAYLRDVACADWGISAEHDTGLTDATWLANQQRVASVEEDRRFVTLVGYEWTPPRRLGHHVVVFEGPPGPGNPLVGASSGRRGGAGASNVAELAGSLRSASGPGHRILLIPHVMQPFPNGDTDRDEHDLPHETWDGPAGSPAGAYVFNDLRRVGEIYSHHNDDFSVDGYRQTKEGRGDAVNQPQLFELGVGNSWSYQHAWATGHRIGVIGGSDNHFGTPGMNDFVPTIPHHAGLAVVLAPELTREAIFSGLYDRHCYATTGARILVDVTVDGLDMGAEAVRTRGARLPIRISVSGTARVESVEVLKYSGGDFIVLPGLLDRANDMDVTMELVDTLDASTLYYVRVRQADGEWAWTSPVWIDLAPPQPS